MTDWNVKVRTNSGYIKDVRVNDCNWREDAEAEALGSTGAREVLFASPWNYRDDEYKSNNSEYITPQNYYVEEPEVDYYDTSSLDDMEEEMYDLMCQIAMSKGEKLPTISEFYEWLESN